MPSRKRSSRPDASAQETGARVRPLWTGTITFGLVSIPVELVTAVRPRQTAMKLVDKSGHALGREYHCSKEGKKLDQDELVRGYETASGKMVVITDEEFESVAPEMLQQGPLVHGQHVAGPGGRFRRRIGAAMAA